MSRFTLRRGRILPGNLRTLPAPRSPVPVTSLALTAAAIAAGLLVMPHFSPRTSPAPTQALERPEAVAVVVEADPPPLVQTAAVERAVAPSPAPAVAARAAPAEAPGPSLPAAKPVAVRTAPAKPAADPSRFRLDLLPALRADAASLDAEAIPAAEPVRTVKPASRRAASAGRGAAAAVTEAPAQP